MKNIIISINTVPYLSESQTIQNPLVRRIANEKYPFNLEVCKLKVGRVPLS